MSAAGPGVHRALQVGIAACAALAWASLGVQVQVLYGSRGLLPVAELLERLRGLEGPDAPGLLEVPSLFWLGASDGLLSAGCAAGLLLSLLALWAPLARPALAASAALYLSYCAVGQDFLGFQWDSLLVEAGLLVAFLPRLRPAPWRLLLVRVLLFKVFFESGVAKALSARGDWWAGTAMQHYYETAPLPTPLAWYAHHLPPAWHVFESWWTLFFELVVPLGIFGPRWSRLGAGAVFLAFLVVDGATASYGFFVPLTGVLLLSLLDDDDLVRLRRGSPTPRPPEPAPPPAPWRRDLVRALVIAHIALSALVFTARFADADPLPWATRAARTWRIANAYHLFGTVTTQRVEVELQVREARGSWLPLALHHKPGPPERAPSWVAPHQPRVDFQLWFYGLSFQRRTPGYVQSLVLRLCEDPEAVQPLFVQALPPAPEAVRLVFFDTRMSAAREADRDLPGAWWTREELDRSRELPCR